MSWTTCLFGAFQPCYARAEQSRAERARERERERKRERECVCVCVGTRVSERVRVGLLVTCHVVGLFGFLFVVAPTWTARRLSGSKRTRQHKRVRGRVRRELQCPAILPHTALVKHNLEANRHAHST